MSVVGIDIGGTNVKLVIVERTGRVLARATEATSPERGPEETIATIIACVRRLGAEAGIVPEALGVGVTGPVDPFTGVVSNPFTLGGWPATDLRAPFRAAFEVPVVVDNDANVAAVGEWWMGAGRGCSRVAMVTLGTGIGVASLIEGKIQRAVDGRHGEAGHMVLNPQGPPCYCGADGCWEVLASGTAIGRAAREVDWRRDGALWRLAEGEPDRIDATLVFAAAAEGDEQAGALVAGTAQWIGLGLLNLASTLMPDVFILAGGVARNLEMMRTTIEAVLHRQAVMVPSAVPVVAAELGDDAGPLGAAKLAIDHLAPAERGGGRLGATAGFSSRTSHP